VSDWSNPVDALFLCAMAIHDSDLEDYCAAHSTPESDVLGRLRRETWLTTVQPLMLSDVGTGRLLGLLSRLMRPAAVLELGTFTGYATVCLAEGLVPGGVVDTVDPDDERHAVQDRFWREAGCADRIRRHTAEALVVLPDLPGPYDLVWIDADKRHTADYVEAAIVRTRPGGLILVDNVLWWGKVLEGNQSQDADARRLHAMNAALARDSRVTATLLPLRDGILLLERR
jgi:predicted O-methyltransferase YrrM